MDAEAELGLEVDEEGYPPVSSETLNASLAEDGFVLENTPFFATGVAFGDCVRRGATRTWIWSEISLLPGCEIFDLEGGVDHLLRTGCSRSRARAPQATGLSLRMRRVCGRPDRGLFSNGVKTASLSSQTGYDQNDARLCARARESSKQWKLGRGRYSRTMAANLGYVRGAGSPGLRSGMKDGGPRIAVDGVVDPHLPGSVRETNRAFADTKAMERVAIALEPLRVVLDAGDSSPFRLAGHRRPEAETLLARTRVGSTRLAKDGPAAQEATICSAYRLASGSLATLDLVLHHGSEVRV